MNHLFIPDIPVLEKVARSILVYMFLLMALRFTGKRQVGQLSPFDLVVLLIISNVVQNAIIGPDNSVGGGFIGVITILLVNALMVELSFRSKKWRRILESTPTLLIHNGKILASNLNRERISMDELMAALRRNSISDPQNVHVAVLEENGSISVVPKVSHQNQA